MKRVDGRLGKKQNNGRWRYECRGVGEGVGWKGCRGTGWVIMEGDGKEENTSIVEWRNDWRMDRTGQEIRKYKGKDRKMSDGKENSEKDVKLGRHMTGDRRMDMWGSMGWQIDGWVKVKGMVKRTWKPKTDDRGRTYGWTALTCVEEMQLSGWGGCMGEWYVDSRDELLHFCDKNDVHFHQRSLLSFGV